MNPAMKSVFAILALLTLPQAFAATSTDVKVGTMVAVQRTFLPNVNDCLAKFGEYQGGFSKSYHCEVDFAAKTDFDQLIREREFNHVMPTCEIHLYVLASRYVVHVTSRNLGDNFTRAAGESCVSQAFAQADFFRGPITVNLLTLQ